tara:strand:+ start:458 stop:1231 length:774 start_codon:yes stop_codon:yes gene_type:complete
VEVDLLPSLGRASLYLGVPFVLMIFVMQYKWAKTCDNYIRILVAQKGGGGKWELAKKEGGTVRIESPDSTVRVWPVNELATIDVLYPGVGFVPSFVQKTIRMAIVNEGDWEPMLNRSPHREKVASPDVVMFLKSLAEKTDNKGTKASITALTNSLSTGPTREMIADPAMLGSLMQSSIMKALATVSGDLIDTLKTINAKLLKVTGPNAMVVYIALGLICVLVSYVVYQTAESITVVTGLEQDLIKIKLALGVTENVP